MGTGISGGFHGGFLGNQACISKNSRGVRGKDQESLEEISGVFIFLTTVVVGCGELLCVAS